MSGTLATQRGNVWDLLTANDPQTRGSMGLGIIRANRVISSQMQRLAGLMLRPREAEQTINLVIGIYDYLLTSGTSNVSQVRINSVGQPLGFVPFERFNAMYRTNSAIVFKGRPRDYTTYETSAQAAYLRIGPTPGSADSLKVWYGVLPADLDSDAQVIPFGDHGLRALEYYSAAQLASFISKTNAATLGIDQAGFIAECRASGLDELKAENMRLAAMNGMRVPTVQRVEV